MSSEPTMTTKAPERRTTCCGQGGAWVPKEGSPLIPSCSLCPKSATFWDPTGEKKAAASGC